MKEAEQSIIQTEKVSTEPQKEALPKEQLDTILRSGGVQENSRKHIYAKYRQGKAPEEIAEFIKKEYGKTLDKVRPGSVVAFVTSKGTMDKKSPEVRKYLAQRAELLGAVRLPNSAVKENAGTEVNSDILFLKKRDRVMDLEPDWVHLSEDANGIAMNSYFAEHPEMIVGKMEMVSGPYGMARAVQKSSWRK